VAGVLTRHPEWENILAGFQAESAWMVGAWNDVQKLVESVDTRTSSVVIARVMLAMREGNSEVVETMLSQARLVLGAPITAAGIGGYRRSYEAALDLHLTHELEMIFKATCTLPQDSQDGSRQERRRTIAELSKKLSRRLDLTLPTFRSREPVLSMRRTAFALS
jgi:serine/threonine-protein kinase ATR